MHVILVRHAQPEVVVDSAGVADPGLSELGRWQADRVCRWLEHEEIDAVITSPKARAIETVGALIQSTGVPHEVIPDLDEIDRRSRTYFPTELLMTHGGSYFEAIVEQRWDDIGWDTPTDFEARVLEAFARIVASPPGERIVVASHGGVMNRWLNHLFRPAERTSFNIPYAAITRVHTDAESGHRVLSVNETGHFDADRADVLGPMGDGTHYMGLG